jgi:hypothetical protein
MLRSQNLSYTGATVVQVIVTEPYKDFARKEVYGVYLLYLVISLDVVALINTHSIDPQNTRATGIRRVLVPNFVLLLYRDRLLGEKRHLEIGCVPICSHPTHMTEPRSLVQWAPGVRSVVVRLIAQFLCRRE